MSGCILTGDNQIDQLLICQQTLLPNSVYFSFYYFSGTMFYICTTLVHCILGTITVLKLFFSIEENFHTFNFNFINLIFLVVGELNTS